MSLRQDKATTERNARILRELVRQPDNKACADCRKNDARWASWNLGVYLCIRCSGIHRSMGTHISKVKSIDLDMWTPEQMENIQKWGNKRANAYWERHLKPGHVPPEHKIESFIRSKYESRRWAMEGPLPKDPSVLDGGAPAPTQTAPPAAAPQTTSPPPAPQAQRHAHPLLSRQQKSAPAPTAAPAAAPAPAPIVDIFGDAQPTPTTAPAPAQAQAQAQAPAPAQQGQPQTTAANMFDLDFRAPSSGSARPQSNKDDIMSLFNKPTATTSAPAGAGGGFFQASPPPPAANPYASWNGGITSSAPPQPQVHTAAVPTWEANPWAQPAPQPTPQQAPPPKKDDRDPFANLWD